MKPPAKFRLSKIDLKQLQKDEGKRFIPVTFVKQDIKSEPLHYTRESIRPDIVSPFILDKIPVRINERSAYLTEEFRRFLDKGIRQGVLGFGKKSIMYFMDTLYEDLSLAGLARKHKVGSVTMRVSIREIKKRLYLHFAKEFGVKVVFDSVYLESPRQLAIKDIEAQFIPGGKHRS